MREEGAGRGKSAARIESRVRVPRVISHRRGRTARGNFTWNALVPLGDIALRGGRRGGQGEGEGQNESGLTSGRLVGSFEEGRSYRGEIFRKEGLYSSRCSSSLRLPRMIHEDRANGVHRGQVEKPCLL